MRWRVTLICALALSLALPLIPARATLQQDYLEIYLKLNDAERLERNGDFKGALEGFQDCYAKLHKIHVSNPDWERVLVNSRMDDCRAKINELEPKVDYAPAAPVTPEAVPITPVTPGTGTTPGPGTTTPATLGDEATLKTRLQEVEQQLAATKAELADTQEKYRNSQLEVQSLHAQIDSVNQQLAALKTSGSVDQNMGKLLGENKELTDKLAAAQAQVKALTSNPKSAVAKLSVQLKNVQDKLAASEAANAGLIETTTSLQQQLDQAQKDLSAANLKLATTGPGSPEYLTLKRENEVMRGILLREIQEQSRRDGAKRLAQEEFDRLKISSKVLQEQLDILGSPMSPPTSDEERTLLASLKVTPAEPTPIVDTEGGNHLGVTTNGTPDTNAAGVTPPAETNNVAAVTPTNAPAATDTNTMATTTPPANTNSVVPPPETNTAAATTTNAPPATNVTEATPPATNAAPAIAESNPPATNSIPATNAIPALTNAPPVAAATNAAPATTNVVTAPAETNIPPAAATNAVAAVTPPATNAPAAATDIDPTRYSNKPRLPEDMRDVAQQATNLFKMQRYDDAAAKYQQIIDKYPESLYAWSNLGVVRSQEGKLPDAMKALQQAVKLSPNDAFSYRNLGIVYYQLNQNDAAIDALERSIALDPNNVYSHDYLGCACSQKGWQEVAEKEFRKAIEIDDNFPDAHYNLAIVYAMQKPPSLELARRHYKRALELGIPKDPRLEKLLGL
jgi:tetratricopeptide (TPR) repeat protein